MIDIRELRKDPSVYITKLSRKGADGLAKELLEVDTAWRAATNEAESLRAKLKSSGKPTPEQLQALHLAKEQFQQTESKLAELERSAKRTSRPRAESAGRRSAEWRRGRLRGPP